MRVGTPGFRDRGSRAIPLRQAEMRIRCKKPVDKALLAIYSALTIADHCVRRAAS
jgi:hypothetical protein